MADDEFGWLEGAIDRSYQKGKGTKGQQVDAIAASVRDMLKQHSMYRPRVPIIGDEPWIVFFVCGHDQEVAADNIRELAIWPWCEMCQQICSITRAAPVDELIES